MGAKGIALVLCTAFFAGALAEKPQCDHLYTKQWTGGETSAVQGGQQYDWVFHPCTPGPANPACNQPPYNGNVYIAQLNKNNPNPCLHQLFCEASPASITKENGDVVYQFPQCVPSQSGNGPSPRSATVTVKCDSPSYHMDTVQATKTNPGYHFEITVHAPCGSVAPGSPGAPPGGKKDKGGFDLGWIFVIVVLVGLAGYFGIGVAFNWFKRGLRGGEAVPNLAFWKDLPLLVKDGVMFVFGRCCGRSGFSTVK